MEDVRGDPNEGDSPKEDSKMVALDEVEGPPASRKSLCKSCQDGFSSLSFFIVNSLESAFHAYGLYIGKHPFVFILICLAFAGVCSIGLINFDTDESELQFMSDRSLFSDAVDWTEENFAYQTHRQIILFESHNVLDKQVLLEMLRIRNEVLNMTVGDIKWDDICAKRLIQKPCSEDMPLEFGNYCEMQDSLGRVCREESILIIWTYDEDLLQSRSQEEIIEDINSPQNVGKASYFLGSKNNWNETDGKYVEAKATMHTWYTDASKPQKENSFKWEESFLNKMKNLSRDAANASLYYTTSSSFGKVVSDNISGDLGYLFAGFILVFLYVTIMLGKFNLVEQRPILSLLGLSCVGLSIAVSYGLSSAFDIPFGAMNSILPFLLLGLGIDDMFVIVTAWNNIPAKYQDQELCQRIAMAMGHAGVSITVTSVTNFLAFIIGSSSELPALRYFCLYAAIGIAGIYFFQATFFVACLAIDQRRLEDNRQGLIWCWKIKNWQPNQCSQTDLCRAFFTIYGRYLFLAPTQIIVLIFTSILFFLSCWGASNIQQEFDPKWFLDPDSYLSKFFQKSDFHYPTAGVPGQIYFSNISHIEMAKTDELVEMMRESDYIERVESWYEKFTDYFFELNGNVSLTNQTEGEFLGNLTNFLYSCEGSKFRGSFRFDKPINCTNDLPYIVASTISYIHREIKTTNEKMKAIENISNMVKDLEFDGFVFPYTQIYVTWETNYVIGNELLQNILLALLMVLLVTLFLLASFYASFLVMVCVLTTLVDVVALMHWWGLTIDTISAIDLVLAIGLSVDYAAHVAYTYLTVAGDATERAQATVGLIGPAVLNGGFTTFLSFLLLAGSDSYVFITFFKIFFAVCLYGLYHGLVFLPVLLSLVDPAPYTTAQQVTTLSSPGRERQVFPTAVRTVEPLPPLSNTVMLYPIALDKDNLHKYPDAEQTPSHSKLFESVNLQTNQDGFSSQSSQSKPSSQAILSRPFSQRSQSRLSSQTSQPMPTSQTTQSRPSSQTNLPRASSQTSQPKPSSNTSQPRSFSQTSQLKPSSQTILPRPFSQTSQSKPSSNTSHPRLFSQTVLSRPFSQTSQSKPSSNTSQHRPFSQTNQSKPSSQTSQTRPYSQTNLPRPSSQISQQDLDRFTPDQLEASSSTFDHIEPLFSHIELQKSTNSPIDHPGSVPSPIDRPESHSSQTELADFYSPKTSRYGAFGNTNNGSLSESVQGNVSRSSSAPSVKKT
ncbi:patched domain-containing protein 3-like [Palaemon carinicauda]|uniref:patched domain-containing protein 3-like n=1 Tax=Palaemon carinicauda TaxID=392227 RepID=UPI0035B5DA29